MINEIWSDPATYTTEQWLVVCIFGFILLATLVMIHRLLTIVKISRRSAYKPNFRRLRRHHWSYKKTTFSIQQTVHVHAAAPRSNYPFLKGAGGIDQAQN